VTVTAEYGRYLLNSKLDQFVFERNCNGQQGCQMVYQTKNRNLGKFCFCGVLQWKMLVYFMDIRSILQPFDIFCGNMVYFSPLWYIALIKIWQPCLKTVQWPEQGGVVWWSSSSPTEQKIVGSNHARVYGLFRTIKLQCC
jgi:hypothetical protein